jgi:phosphoglycerate dehydrogenase-like enzyme
LYRRNNVVLTPHVAGWTHESKFKIADTILTKWKSRNSDNF